jgi:ABC-type transport system involved in cytochrome bd biosynthesis fused ATPase/permease subunit
MNRNRLIFYIVFGAFHLGAFVFTAMLSSDTGLLFKMVSFVPAFKWITFFGLVLLITDLVWSFVVHRTSSKEKAALTHELNTLKAKLFDLQEAAKKQAVITDTKK